MTGGQCANSSVRSVIPHHLLLNFFHIIIIFHCYYYSTNFCFSSVSPALVVNYYTCIMGQLVPIKDPCVWIKYVSDPSCYLVTWGL